MSTKLTMHMFSNGMVTMTVFLFYLARKSWLSEMVHKTFVNPLLLNIWIDTTVYIEGWRLFCASNELRPVQFKDVKLCSV